MLGTVLESSLYLLVGMVLDTEALHIYSKPYSHTHRLLPIAATSRLSDFSISCLYSL